MRILLIEDEQKLQDMLVDVLTTEGFEISAARNGIEGVELFLNSAYDLVILDISLPGLNGSKILQKIRETDLVIPILMLTARDSAQDKVWHLEAGADDYLTKPFSIAELLARIKALFRRSASQLANTVRHGDFELDRLAHKVKRAGAYIDLSSKEYTLLEYLVSHVGHVLSRNMIIEHVWDKNFETLTNIVDVYIRQLRNKIDKGHEQKLIHTIRGRGYLFGDGVSA
jgi:two-component system copper resistance phosphate regulon response regulator CusR